MNRVIIPATSLTIGRGLEFGLTNGGGNEAILSINFSPPFAEDIAETLFQPHARPEHFITGMTDTGSDKVEISAYFVASLDTLVTFPWARALIFRPEMLAASPSLYVIGTDADISREAVQLFSTLRAESGTYLLTCGYHPPEGSISRSVTSGWRIRLHEFVTQRVHERLLQAIGQSRG